MYKFICVYVYLYMQREGPERIYAKLFTVIASGGWHWRAGGHVGICILAGVLCFYFCIV